MSPSVPSPVPNFWSEAFTEFRFLAVSALLLAPYARFRCSTQLLSPLRKPATRPSDERSVLGKSCDKVSGKTWGSVCGISDPGIGPGEEGAPGKALPDPGARPAGVTA